MMLLDFNDALKYYKSLNYIGTWGPILMIVLLTLTKGKRPPRDSRDKSKLTPENIKPEAVKKE
jgi:hypothetical protein